MRIQSLGGRAALASMLQFRPSMRMTKLNHFFRDVGTAISRSPEVGQAVRQVEKQVAKDLAARLPRFSDGFEAAKPSPVSRNAADADFVTGLYRDLLGRAPDAEGFRSHLGGLARGMSRDEIRQVFLSSPEYRATQAVTEPAAPVAPKVNSADPSKLGPVPLEGFDSRKLSDPSHASVKYLFGRVATHFSLDSVKDKAGAEALLNKMVPDLQAAGLDIVGVKGDRLLMKTPLGLESIDVVRGAGGGNPGWWWGADGTVASPQEIARFPPLAAPAQVTPTAPNNPGALVEPGAALSTVPLSPEYVGANIDKSSPEAAALSAAKWAKQKYPQLFARSGDRQVCYEIMTKVIGALRVAGFDATRVVNHPDRAMGDGWRYGSDALVLNGSVFDVYRGMGESNEPQSMNAGPYEAGRLRE